MELQIQDQEISEEAPQEVLTVMKKRLSPLKTLHDTTAASEEIGPGGIGKIVPCTPTFLGSFLEEGGPSEGKSSLQYSVLSGKYVGVEQGWYGPREKKVVRKERKRRPVNIFGRRGTIVYTKEQLKELIFLVKRGMIKIGVIHLSDFYVTEDLIFELMSLKVSLKYRPPKSRHYNNLAGKWVEDPQGLITELMISNTPNATRKRTERKWCQKLPQYLQDVIREAVLNNGRRLKFWTRSMLSFVMRMIREGRPLNDIAAHIYRCYGHKIRTATLAKRWKRGWFIFQSEKPSDKLAVQEAYAWIRAKVKKMWYSGDLTTDILSGLLSRLMSCLRERFRQLNGVDRRKIARYGAKQALYMLGLEPPG